MAARKIAIATRVVRHDPEDVSLVNVSQCAPPIRPGPLRRAHEAWLAPRLPGFDQAATAIV